MLINDISDRIAFAADAVELGLILKDAWCQHTHGYLSEGEIETLDEFARARREALQARRTETRPSRPPTAPSGAPRGSARRLRPCRDWNREESIRRRRRGVAQGWMPPHLADMFTWGEQAALAIIAQEVERRGFCDLCIDRTAAIAGYGRTTVQDALREAKRLNILTVDERRRPGQRSLTNIVRITSPEWLTWLQKRKGVLAKRDAKGGGFRKSSTTHPGSKKERETRTGLPQARTLRYRARAYGQGNTGLNYRKTE